ncbi:MAG: hypothetical protein XD81_0946 [Bacteroidetes bacterium 38_7]|nr:MAG: hypothetical protein XD81_0946 [Bacteroidetes bacterium 38_7]
MVNSDFHTLYCTNLDYFNPAPINFVAERISVCILGPNHETESFTIQAILFTQKILILSDGQQVSS